MVFYRSFHCYNNGLCLLDPKGADRSCGGTEMIMVVIKIDDVLKPAILKRVKKKISEKINDLSQVD